MVENGEVRLPDDKPATESLAGLAKFLIENDFIKKEDVPIEGGSTRYLINTEPIHQNDKEMIRPKEVQEYYLECNYSVSSIKNKVFYLLDNASLVINDE